MQQFEDRQDLKEWLETLNYETFWQEAEPFGMGQDYRANCDLSIAKGASKDTVLYCLKAELRLKILEEQDLKSRIYHQPPSLH